MCTRRLALLACLAAPALASADVLYHSDFEAGIIDPQWGPTARLDQGAAFTKFMGRYSENIGNVLNNSVSLTLPLPGDGLTTVSYTYQLGFDFYPIDSWDGNNALNGPDLFEVSINNNVLFSYTFSNSAAAQSYPGAPNNGPSYLGFNTGDKDSIYRAITVPFQISNTNQIVIKWRSNGLQGMSDESWGIDNVNVTYTVPTPGSLALLGAGALTLARRRRR